MATVSIIGIRLYEHRFAPKEARSYAIPKRDCAITNIANMRKRMKSSSSLTGSLTGSPAATGSGGDKTGLLTGLAGRRTSLLNRGRIQSASSAEEAAAQQKQQQLSKQPQGSSNNSLGTGSSAEQR